MKGILFAEDAVEDFEALQSKIHLYLISKNGIDGFKYSAGKWACSKTCYTKDNQLVLEIDESEPRHSLILEALDQSEIDAIQEITIEDNI